MVALVSGVGYWLLWRVILESFTSSRSEEAFWTFGDPLCGRGVEWTTTIVLVPLLGVWCAIGTWMMRAILDGRNDSGRRKDGLSGVRAAAVLLALVGMWTFAMRSTGNHTLKGAETCSWFPLQPVDSAG